MKVTIQLDLNDEEDKMAYEEILLARRNCRFWDGLYDEVFRKVIKYEEDPEMAGNFSLVWDEIKAFMDELGE